MDYTPPYVDGSFQVDMELDPAKVQEATKAALFILEQVALKGIDVPRIARAKTQMKAARVKRMQTSEDVAETMATDYLATGDAHFQEHYIEQIDRVTPAQIKAVAAKYFNTNKLLTTALLPQEFTGAAGLPKAEALLRPTSPATLESGPMASSDIQRIDLGDDTVLLTRRVSTSPLVVMQVYSLGGLTAEDDKTNGLGNLTMQMLSRGTKSQSAQQIAEFWDSIGGDFEATSGNNSWSWTATCLKDDFAKAYGQFAEQVNNPSFPKDELDPMKKRVIAAIQGQDADWTAQAFRFFKKTYYGPMGSPYQFMPSGTEKNVEGFKIEQVRDWYGKQVLGHKKVIAVFGDVDPKVVEAMVRKMPIAKTPAPAAAPAEIQTSNLSGVVLGKAPSHGIPNNSAVAIVQSVALNKTEQQLAGIVIGYQSNSIVGEPAVFPIAVGDTMASGYQYGAGYLYEILRGRGLVYVVHGQNSPGLSKDLPGTFLVYAGCEPAKVNEVVDVILENIARLQGTPADMNENWFKRSKELIVVAEAMDTQTPAQQATQAALDELYGLGYKWHQKFAEQIKAVNLDDVRKIAAERLTRCVVTVSTPKPELVNAKAGVRNYASFPKVELTPRGVQHDTGGAGGK
jgi:zinc protease